MLSTSPDMRNSHPHYLFHSTSQRFRQIKEKPIMGIDYSKLCGGGSRFSQNASGCCYSPNGSSQMFFQPKDSLIKNQTASSFRSNNQQRLSFQHRPSVSQQKLHFQAQKLQSTSAQAIIDPQQQQQNLMRMSTNSLPAQDAQEQFDFETFKKYSKEFQEFRKQKRLLQTAEQKRYLNKSANVRQSDDNDKKIQNEKGSSQEVQNKSKEDDRSRQQNQQSQQQQTRQLRMRTEQSNDLQKNQKSFQTQQSYLETEQPQNNEDVEQVAQNGDNCQENQPNNNNNNCNQTNQDFKGSQCSSKVFQESEGGYGGGDSQVTFDPNSTQYTKMVTNYFDKNSDYYKHLRGDCLCARCICGKCKCSYKGMPVDLKNSMQSMYMQDFQRFKNLDQLPSLTMDFHTQPKGTGHIKCLSTTQSDFKSHDVKEPHRFKGPQQAQNTSPFFATTNYQNNFIDWKSQSTGLFRPPLEPTVVHAAPFIGKTVYADSFYRKEARDKEFEEFIKSKSKSNLKSPMNPDIRYAAETTNQKFFKEFSKTNKTPTLAPYQYKVGITPAPTQQFKSEAMNEYEDKSQIVCPSRLALMERNKQRKLEKDSEFEEMQKLKSIQDKFPPSMNQILNNSIKSKQSNSKI